MNIQVSTNERSSFVGVLHINHAISHTTIAVTSKRVNWIYAIAQFTDWTYAITKTEVGNMPLKLHNTSIYAIVSTK